MARLRTLLTLSLALGLGTGSLALAQTDYLRPGSPYTFAGFPGSVTLPGTGYPEWSVFNAFYDSTEDSGMTFSVNEEGGTKVLAFDMPNDDPTAFLALGIRDTASGSASLPIFTPASGVTVPTAHYRRLKARVRLPGGGSLPDIETFRCMYPTVDDREDPEWGERVAAKLGLVVAQGVKPGETEPKDFLYVTRVRVDPLADQGTADRYRYEFCQTAYEVAPDAGLVDIEVEFRTIQLTTGTLIRAYRVWVGGTCVTEGIGYPWGETDPTGTTGWDYTFDFNSLGSGPWLFTVEEAEADLGQVEPYHVDSLNQIGFSANGGALAQVEVFDSSMIPLEPAAGGVGAGPLYPMATPDSDYFGLYERWASTKGGNGLVTLTEADEAIYDEFLLDMQADSETDQRLTVTGLTVETSADGSRQMTLTVLAPEGGVLGRNSRLCVTRAPTLADLETAKPVWYGTAVTISADGASAVIALPVEEDGVDKPFLKVTAEPMNLPVEMR